MAVVFVALLPIGSQPRTLVQYPQVVHRRIGVQD